MEIGVKSYIIRVFTLKIIGILKLLDIPIIFIRILEFIENNKI